MRGPAPPCVRGGGEGWTSGLYVTRVHLHWRGATAPYLAGLRRERGVGGRLVQGEGLVRVGVRVGARVRVGVRASVRVGVRVRAGVRVRVQVRVQCDVLEAGVELHPNPNPNPNHPNPSPNPNHLEAGVELRLLGVITR